MRVPPPRPSADELFDAGHAAVGEIRNLVADLHDRAAQSPDRGTHLRAVADVVNACGTQLWRDLVEGVPPALLAAFKTADLPQCLGLRRRLCARRRWCAGLERSLTVAGGREVTPKDAASTERLMKYWAEGPGAAKIQWNSPGDYDRCVVELGKYVGPSVVHGLCQNLHQRATGFSAGKAPGDGPRH